MSVIASPEVFRRFCTVFFFPFPPPVPLPEAGWLAVLQSRKFGQQIVILFFKLAKVMVRRRCSFRGSRLAGGPATRGSIHSIVTLHFFCKCSCGNLFFQFFSFGVLCCKKNCC